MKHPRMNQQEFDLIIQNLRDTCFEKGWSQAHAARLMNVTTATLNRIINSAKAPKQKNWHLQRIMWFVGKSKEGSFDKGNEDTCLSIYESE